MLEVQLQQQQNAAKQATESKRQRDSEKMISLERQVLPFSLEYTDNWCSVA